MRRVVKNIGSEIVSNKLKYTKGSSANNRKIADILFVEQKKFCAYTDEFLSRSDAMDIEHFNPTFKGTSDDNYNNWFLVKHQWNREKASKWHQFQPVLHPTADDFEERIIYIEGDCFAKSEEDVEAKNLIALLNLDDLVLADNRKKYIARKADEMNAFGMDAYTFFSFLINDDPVRVLYLRAINESFNIDIWEMLL
jgi:hypothetical protein